MGAGRRHHEAMLILERLIGEAEDLGEVDRSRVVLEIVWNELRLQPSGADHARLRLQVLECFRGLVDEDDLAFAHSIMAQICEIEGNYSSMLMHKESMAHYAGVFRRRQSEIRILLSGANMLDVDFIRNVTSM